jgi:hypothetical protein
LADAPPALPPTPVAAPITGVHHLHSPARPVCRRASWLRRRTSRHTLACFAAALYHVGPDDRMSQFFETTFDVSVNEMFACWNGGASLHVVPETKHMAPGGFIRQPGIHHLARGARR